jgi:hypothetical protein
MIINLNVELTDEQVDQLMNQSYDRIFESDEFKDAMRESVIDNISDWLKRHPELIKQAMWGSQNSNFWHSGSSYDGLLASKIIRDTLDCSDYHTEVTQIIKDSITNILEKSPLDTIIMQIIKDSVMRGLTGGLKEHVDYTMDWTKTIQDEIAVMRSKLNKI